MKKAFVVLMAFLLTLHGSVPGARMTSHAAPASAAATGEVPANAQMALEGTYRTHLTLRHPRDLQRVRDLGVTVLEAGDDAAVALVSAEQLMDLARLGFRPSKTDRVDDLTLHDSGLDAAGLQLTAQSSPDLLLAASSTDSDGDGLTDTEETWWCTNPNSADSDNDLVSDGDEVSALVDWAHDPRVGRPASGKPFISWPPNLSGCYDDDYDSVPDLAEVSMLGMNINRESTDRDKFDDGQELFGNTYCPGSGAYCGYGALPRDDDWGVIFAEMPAWVRAPGNHPLVAAFPVPEVSVVEGSWTVERVTTITTEEGEMVESTHSYETSVTRGQSTSVANTVTWNEWEEVSEALESPSEQLDLAAAPQHGVTAMGRNWGKTIAGGIMFAGGTVAGAAICAGSWGIGCAVGAVVFAAAAGYGWDKMKEGWSEDPSLLDTPKPSRVYDTTIINNVSVSADTNASVMLNQPMDFQGLVNSLDGLQYAINQQGDLLARQLYDINYTLSQPRLTETRTNGHSYGGAQTTTHTTYEEHAISEGQAFASGQTWSTAWAVDSSHAADLTFSYVVENTGTEYAREIAGLIFNVYLGDDLNPIVSYPAWEQFSGGELQNVFPDATHTFASNPVPLTLEQMKRIDLGERLTVVLEDYSYGIDELFYQDAIDSGITVQIEDGVEDGDELVDAYVIPTWGAETVQDVLMRYFPALRDDEGNLTSLWTPEFDGTNPPTWHEHFLSDIAWWNIYQTCQPESCASTGSTPLQEQAAQAGAAILFRFSRDSDRDGYPDRVEARYGTDKHSASSYPVPELTAGYVATRNGNVVTVQLALQNDGGFDAYGINAVMYAPDDTTTIGNNTVGGNGRVRPGQHVAIGSRIMPPELGNWGSSAAQPYVAGSYAGVQDKTYTFSVLTPGVVGQGSAAIAWNDGTGTNGTLDLGSTYHAPLPIDVGTEGLQVGFDTGTLAASESFAVAAMTARDTFTYTINVEPYTPPVIVVSYSDPQGSHRFIAPVELGDLREDLSGYSDQILRDVGLQIVTDAPFDASKDVTTSFILNSPHPSPVSDAHLYVHIIGEGRVVASMPHTLTLQPGPTVLPVTWDTSVFTEPYTSTVDYLMLAFWTDWQGNIIDTAGRMLSTFGVDPQPTFSATQVGTTWDLGVLYKGETVYRELTLANIGHTQLVLGAQPTDGMSPVTELPRHLLPIASHTAGFLFDTDTPGSLNGDLSIRTSDLDRPIASVHIAGVVELLPDLRVGLTDISFSDPSPSPGQTLTISATIHNEGPGNAHSVLVRFYDDDPRSGGTQIGDEQVFTSIAADSTHLAQTGWTYQDGYNTVFVQIDPLDTIPEQDEMNNISLGFLNVSTALPPDGVVDGHTVLVLDDPSELTETAALTVTDEATLVMREMTATLDSITLDGTSALVLEGVNLDLISVQSLQAAVPKYVRIISSTLGLQDPFSVTVGIFEAVDTTLQIVGSDGAKGADNHQPPFIADPGSPGSPAVFYVRAQESIFLRSVESYLQGGRGGNGGNELVGGAGGVGGGAGAQLQSARRIQIEDSQFDLVGGDGGHGGDYGGHGGSGGESFVKIDGDGAVLLAVDVSAVGGTGGDGGAERSDGPNGGGGGQGGLSHFEAFAASLSISQSSFVLDGGVGGLGGPSSSSQSAGGGGTGGSAMGMISGTHVILIDTTIRETGEPGQQGGPGGRGGNGGHGGSVQFELTAEHLDALNLELDGMAGDGGKGSECPSTVAGNDAGDGGSATQQISATTVTVAEMQSSVTGGNGGTGGCGASGGTGGDGGNASQLMAAISVLGDVIRVDATGGDGGLGGSGISPYGGDGGNGGDCIQSWRSDLSLEAVFGLLECNRGTRGLGGDHGGSPGAWGIRDISLYDGYSGSHLAGTEMLLEKLQPSLLLLTGISHIEAAWDATLTTTLSVPYPLAIPENQGFHRLDVLYHLSDGSAAESTYWVYAYQDTAADYDGDGLSDITEAVEHETDPVLADTDGDGLNDGNEIAARTDPHSPDSDYDGIPDGEDPDAIYWPDLMPSSGPAFSQPSPAEGMAITLSADVSNVGSRGSEGIVVAFFDGDPDSGGRYICADFVESIPTSTAELAECTWDTSGVTGTREIYVVADPTDRIAEEDEGNNIAHASITVLTKPDLRIDSFVPQEAQVVEGDSLVVDAVLYNSGQSDAPASTIALYEGTPTAGTLVYTTSVAVGAGSTVTVPLPWTATVLGPQLLSAYVDQGDVVAESQESNNVAQTTVHVGWSTPVYVDAGGTPDPVYSAASGYGLTSAGTSAISSCGSAPDETYRQGVFGEPLEYRFDHLLPGHAYHLDVTMSVCSGQRMQYLWVDGVQVAGPFTVTASSPVRYSLLVDPGSYTDHSIVVGVTASGAAVPAVAGLTLTDVYYCYRDSGSADNDPLYSPDIRCGYYDPSSQGADMWGSAPEQTIRFDPNDNDVVYRFSGLQSAAQYALRLTLYEGDGVGRQETVRIDGAAVGPAVTLTGEPQYLTVDVPPETYESDGIVDVAVVETMGWHVPVVSEIGLKQLTLAIHPTAGFGTSPLVGTTPLTVTFTSQSTGVIHTYEWSFGDGYTSTQQSPVHIYAVAGEYTVTLTVSGPGGVSTETKPSLIAAFDNPLGDCNGDGIVDSGDVSALVLEIFDGDGDNPLDTPGGTFAGHPASDANQDGVVDAGDISCVVLTIFGGPNACQRGCGPSSEASMPVLSIPDRVQVSANSQVSLPVTFAANGSSVSGLVFSVDYDEDWLTFDPTDGDGDGLPDAITFVLPGGFDASVAFDVSDANGELDFFIADLFPSLEPLPDGVLVYITFNVGDLAGATEAAVDFAVDPLASFGSTSGRSIPGLADRGSVTNRQHIYLPLVMR